MSVSTDGERTRIVASDGYVLGAMRYAVSGPVRGRLIVAGATAVPQRFYARFAVHASRSGFETVTFDYRGVGGSRSGRLAGFQASCLDWAELDLAAVVEEMAGDAAPLFVVAHSFGGHAVGLLPNHRRLAGCYAFATGAGWYGWMEPLERLRSQLLWKVVLPPIVAWKGYLPWSSLGMGEDLPRDVYRQWRRWCQFPRYFLDDPELPELRARCASVRMPLVAATALDDAWAPPRSRDAFMLAAYPHAGLACLDIDPRPYGGIGHLGYFRPNAAPLWDRALGWFAQRAEGLPWDDALDGIPPRAEAARPST